MSLKKFLVNTFVCGFIPDAERRRTVRNRFLSTGKNNKIVLVKPDGTKRQTSYVRGLSFCFDGDNNYVEIHEPCNFFKCSLVLGGNAKIIISATKHHIHRMNIGTPGMPAADTGVIIKDNLLCNGATLHPGKNGAISIGRDCMFSAGIVIKTSNDHLVYDMNGPRPPALADTNRPVVIGNHVWLCINALLMKGAVISDNSIVAANAVATKKFLESNIVIAGNPAKTVKENIMWEM